MSTTTDSCHRLFLYAVEGRAVLDTDAGVTFLAFLAPPFPPVD